jgi:hypothetical protein
MPSSTLRRTIIAAIFCTICTLHSAVAEPQNSSWPDLFNCAKKNTLWAVAGISSKTYYNSNRMTDQRGQEWADGLFGGGTSAAKKAAPYISAVGKSPRFRAAAGLATISAVGLWAYEYITCPQ